MPTFSYVSGNPANLDPGDGLNMVDIQGPFTDLRSAINGSLDETNVPNLSAAFTTYKNIVTAYAAQSSGGSAGTFGMHFGPPTTTDISFNTANAAPWLVLIPLDPTDFNANTRTTKLRVRAAAVPSIAPGMTFTIGLYPVATYAAPGGGVHPRVATLGTVVSGSTAVIASPANGVLTTAVSADFNFPAAGAYVLGIAQVALPAAGSVTDIIAQLQMRQV